MSSPDRAPRARSTLDVLDVIRRRPAVTQPELVAATKLSRGTVAAVVRYLHDLEVIEPAPLPDDIGRATEGRPASPIQFRSDMAPSICVDLGSRHVVVALGGLKGFTRDPEIRVFDDDLVATQALEIATELVQTILSRDPLISPGDLVGMCVAVAAPVDQMRGQADPGGVSTWIGIRPAEELKYRLGPAWENVPFILHNNANLDILAEHEYGVVRQHLSNPQAPVLLVRWGNGIGGAALIHGKLLTGARGIATELGHTPVHIGTGEPELLCPRCRHYCLDSVASGNALTASLARITGENISFDALIERAIAVDGVERKLVTTAAEQIGQVVGNYVSFLNAPLVVISGHHFGEVPHDVRAYTLVADAIRTGIRNMAFSPTVEDLDIAFGELGRLSTVQGGILAVLHERLPSFFEDMALAPLDIKAANV